ncbi:MAG: MerR family transcriptional regulator [Lachnospiraceae bacterium]|nr:MerR family transcriptional regulator [Lachnospiraceae bacterium]
MSHTRYIISDASKQLEVEPHVLRYWEEELQLDIPRNAMGHRYYREEELTTIRGIKKLKEQGFQLKAIKLILPSIDKIEKLPEEARKRLCSELNEKIADQEKTSLILHTEMNINQGNQQEQKMEQFQTIMTRIIQNALVETNKNLSKDVSKEVTTSVVKAVDYQFRMHEEREEAHYRKIDEAIRNCQKKKKRKGLFHRR